MMKQKTKKRNSKKQNRKQLVLKKQIAYLALFLLVIFVGMVLHYRLTYHLPTEVYQHQTTIEFVWNGTSYKGSYSGDFANTQPNGIGTFVSQDGTLQYEGQWKKGLFDGEGVITYADGTVEEGSFQKGKRNGRVRLHSSEDNYVETIYEEDVPYARSDAYKDGAISEVSYYVNATPISDIIEDALPLTQKILDDKSYRDHYISVEGEIVSVVEDEEICYFRLKSDTVGMVYGSFANTMSMLSHQVLLPNMQKGDHVQIYGYYMGRTKNENEDDIEGYGKTYLTVEPYLGIPKGYNIQNAMDTTYKEVAKQPYLYSGQSVEGNYVILDVIDSGNYCYLKVCRKGAEKEIYVLNCEWEPNQILSRGTEIQVSGYYDGQYKIGEPEEQDETISENASEMKFDYKPYPAIRVEEIR